MTKTPEELAELIIQRANDGYHRRDDYPPFALTPWDDRLRWSDYLKKVAADVLRDEEEAALNTPPETITIAPQLLHDTILLVDDMTRFVGQMSLRDYELLNTVPIRLLEAANEQEGNHTGCLAPGRHKGQCGISRRNPR